MSSLVKEYSLFEGELPIDFSWVLKLTEEHKVELPVTNLGESSSPDRMTSSSGSGSPDGEHQGLGLSTQSLPKMAFNPWVQPFNPVNCWEPFPQEPTRTLSQSVGQSQETIPLWSQPQPGASNGELEPIQKMSPVDIFKPAPVPIYLCPPQLLALEPNGDKYWGISADKFTDRLYVGDRGNNDVIVIDPVVGKPILRFGQDNILRYSSNQLYRPTGLVADGTNKRLLVCDKDNHRVCIFTMDGQLISTFGQKGHGQSEFNYPWDIDISPNGDMIVVSDSKNHRIQFFDRFGNYLKKFTIFESDPFDYKKHFDYPRGITFNNDGKTVYCTDFNTNNIIGVDVDTLEYKRILPFGKLNRPQGIIMNELGNLLVCDSRKHCIRAITPNGDLLSSLNRIGRIQLSIPVDSCILGGGQVATLGINGRIYFL